MKATLHSTEAIVTLNGIPARIWEGETESGIKIHAYITRVAIDKDEPPAEFERELLEQRVPSTEVRGIPLRMII